MLFNETVKWKILVRFFEEPEQEFFVKELAREIKIGAGSASQICKELEKEGILISKVLGRAKFYFLKNDNPLVLRLKSTWFLGELMKFENCWIHEEIQSVALYGSRASGEFVSKSDVDMLVISNMKKEEINKLFEKLRKKFGEAHSLFIFSLSEWRKLAKKKDRFYIEVLSNHILLSGTPLVIG
jgi:hypothetical protein